MVTVTMFVNVHIIRPGESRFTLYLTDAPPSTPEREVWIEEVDVIAPSRASVAAIIEAAREDLTGYPAQTRVVGIVNQSEGYLVAEDRGGDLR